MLVPSGRVTKTMEITMLFMGRLTMLVYQRVYCGILLEYFLFRMLEDN